MNRILISTLALAGALVAQAEVFDYDLTKPQPVYTDSIGYGYDFGTQTDPKSKIPAPFYFSAKVPEGNYKVTLTLGNRKKASNTTVRAENRRLLGQNIEVAKGKTAQKTFFVNTRRPEIADGKQVRINPREIGVPSWDDKLTLEFTGPAPAVQNIRIEPVTEADSVVTFFLVGNSTVVDQAYEPWASWGQIIPAWFDSHVVVANHAESGQRASSFIDSNRWDKVMSQVKPGDYIIVEFGHNDQKEKGPGKGAYYNFAHNVKLFIDQAREAGANIILATPAARRQFDDQGKIKDTHLDYPQAIRDIAARENVPLIDLNEMTKTLYAAWGPEKSKKAFVHYPANTFPDQPKALADNTHFNPFGATEIARCIAEGLKASVPALAAHLVDVPTFDPANPDQPEDFTWYPAQLIVIEKPYGD